MKLSRNFWECAENFSKRKWWESIGWGRDTPKEFWENFGRSWRNFHYRSIIFRSISFLSCTYKEVCFFHMQKFCNCSVEDRFLSFFSLLPGHFESSVGLVKFTPTSNINFGWSLRQLMLGRYISGFHFCHLFCTTWANRMIGRPDLAKIYAATTFNFIFT